MSDFPLIFEDENFKIEQSQECLLPGYVILFVKKPCTILANLNPKHAQQLMQIIQTTQQIIQQIIKPEKIYLCSFCEINPQLHYHIFPRTLEITRQYISANQLNSDTNIDGLKLLSWAKSKYKTPLSNQERAILHEKLIAEFKRKICSAFIPDEFFLL